jgi:hypothetical protein
MNNDLRVFAGKIRNATTFGGFGDCCSSEDRGTCGTRSLCRTAGRVDRGGLGTFGQTTGPYDRVTHKMHHFNATKSGGRRHSEGNVFVVDAVAASDFSKP